MKKVAIPIDPAVAELTAITAKPVIEKGVKRIVEKVKEMESKLSNNFEIVDKEMRLICPDRLQKFSLLVEGKRNSIFGHKVDFRHGIVRRCTIHPQSGLSKIDAITINDQGFTLDLKKLASGEKYFIDIEYYVEDEKFLDALVDRRRPKETPGADFNQYWMVAQLKHPEALKGEYGKMELYDLDFSVNVGLTQDLRTKIPNIFRGQIQQLARIAGPLGRDELFREYAKLQKMKSKKYGKEALELLGDLQKLFLPNKFSEFIEVSKEDFYYGSCERGVDEFDVPFSWPRSMNVISRTDLSLDNPVSKGTLTYKKNLFIDEIGKIFE